jgi:IS30 family transposase
MRRSRHATVSGLSRGQIVDAISIREKPAEVEDRAIPGHWEGDLLSGAKNSYIATLVERHSRFAMLIKVPSKETEAVVAALSRHVRKLPARLKRSLTWDRGLEMAKHKDFTVATDVQVYFCDPQSPRQRGTNENTNLLLRQYFPRGTDVSGGVLQRGMREEKVTGCGRRDAGRAYFKLDNKSARSRFNSDLSVSISSLKV